MKQSSIYRVKQSSFAMAAVMGAMLIAPHVEAVGPAHAESGAFRQLAADLMTGISDTEMSRIPARGGYGAPRIAVWPFENDDAPVPASLSGEYNDRLMAALSRQGRGRLQLVARGTLKTLIRDIEGTGEMDDTVDARVADLLKSASVDILVIGKMRRDGNAVMLSYKALNVENGAILAATAPRRLPLDADSGDPAGAVMSLDQAVRDAAARLAAARPDMRRLKVDILKPAEGTKPTPFGAYMPDRVADRISDRYAGRFSPSPLQLTTAADKAAPGDYRLHGVYWDLGGSFEVRLTLTGPEGKSAIWRDRIRTRTIPTALLERPREPRPFVRDDAPRRPMFHPPGPPHPPRGRPRVAEAQRLLHRLGYDPGPNDGRLKPRTRRAIGDFQRDSGLVENGRMTREVVENLRRATHRR